MACIEVDIDIDDYLDEASDASLIDEVKYRAKIAKKTLGVFLKDESTNNGTLKEKVCDLLGLNYLASNDDIVIELFRKI